MIHNLECDTVVLYHRGCNDGIAAAWAAYQYFGEKAIYLPYQYGEKLPSIVGGRHLIMVDLSLPEDMVGVNYPGVKSLLIIDHHKTAERLVPLMTPVDAVSDYLTKRAQGERLFLYFDMAYSGAVLTWAFVNDFQGINLNEVPLALCMIQDYDLWKHEMVGSRQFNAFLGAGERTIERFSSALTSNGGVRLEVLQTGQVILDYDRRIAESVVKNYKRVIWWGGRDVAAINAPAHLRNEIGDLLADQYAVVACYTVRREEIVFSLRSAKQHNVDVREMAERFGGGGHKTAAAFSIPADSRDLKALQWLFECTAKQTLMRRIIKRVRTYVGL